MSKGNTKSFFKACEDINDGYIIEIQRAKRERYVAITKLLTDTLTGMIKKESDKIISDIKDDNTDITTIEMITYADLFYRLTSSIKDPLKELENVDIEMSERSSESESGSDTNSDSE